MLLLTDKSFISLPIDFLLLVSLQAAFLSTLVGVDVAEVAARAAVTALSDLVDMKHNGMGF